MNPYQNVIIEHAMTSEANMRVALLAGLSFPELRKRLIDEFVAELNIVLCNSDWVCNDKEAWSKNLWLRYSKRNWPENISVGIGPHTNFSGHYFGVIAHNKVVKEELRREISVCLQEIQRAKIEDYCAWCISFEKAYGNLNSMDGLLAISEFHRHEAVDDLAHRIEQVGNALEPLFAKWQSEHHFSWGNHGGR